MSFISASFLFSNSASFNIRKSFYQGFDNSLASVAICGITMKAGRLSAAANGSWQIKPASSEVRQISSPRALLKIARASSVIVKLRILYARRLRGIYSPRLDNSEGGRERSVGAAISRSSSRSILANPMALSR